MSNSVAISELNQVRISNDACIAINSLEGILICGAEKRLHPDYLKEKVEVAQRCIDFMKNFYDEGKT